jgi:UDP-N-acetylglucosamine:LPS N-acetylglucosamine transferase
MDLHMRAADVIVGKPGGISVAEAMACGRPLFATRSLGGQEGFNVRFLEQHRVGGLVADSELPQRIQALVKDSRALADAQVRAWALGNRHGASRVAELMLDLSWERQSHILASAH